eukprot:8495431-Alexandrium_andersonii.AAC.1
MESSTRLRMASGVVHWRGGAVADDAPADVSQRLMPARSSVAGSVADDAPADVGELLMPARSS